MAGHAAPELERATLGEPPDPLAGLGDDDVRLARAFGIHVGVPAPRLGVLRAGRENEIAIAGAAVDDDETGLSARRAEGVTGAMNPNRGMVRLLAADFGLSSACGRRRASRP